MGDNFQIIADVEAAEAGYPPGPDYAAAVTTPDGALSALRAAGTTWSWRIRRPES